MDGPYVNGAMLADELGVTRSAVSNWIKRNSLPPHLRPLRSDVTPHVPVWPKSQVPALRAWHESQPRRLPARKTAKKGKIMAAVQEKRLAQLEQFLAVHEGIVSTALEVYGNYMSEEAGRARAAYDDISADPERAAARDQTLMTTRGLKMSAEIFEDAARRAGKALIALQELEEEEGQ